VGEQGGEQLVGAADETSRGSEQLGVGESAGDGFGVGVGVEVEVEVEVEVSDMAVLVLELMRCRLHPGFLLPVFARSRAIASDHETRVDRMPKRPMLARVRARTADSMRVFEVRD
jgi:hypothetical protein